MPPKFKQLPPMVVTIRKNLWSELITVFLLGLFTGVTIQAELVIHAVTGHWRPW